MCFFCTMNFEESVKLVESTLKHLGVNPEEARCEDQGQWLLYRDDREIYIDVWNATEPETTFLFDPHLKDPVIFQVISPVGFLPDENVTAFMAELLHLNLNLQYAGFTVNEEEKMFAVKFRRTCDGLTADEIAKSIDSTGYYANLSAQIFAAKYDLKLILPE